MLERAASEPRPESSRIHALTSLRFFAALYVVFFHILVKGQFTGPIPKSTFLGKFLAFGPSAVSFFFLLSGYILSYVYLRRPEPLKALSFYRTRFARIYPLFLLTLILDTPTLFSKLESAGGETIVRRIATQFLGAGLLLEAWLPRLPLINSPSWSISVEAFFYLLFPALGVALWRLSGARLWMTAAALYLAGQALVLILASRINEYTIYFLPPLHLSTFALGILLARAQFHPTKIPGRFRRPSNRILAILLTAALFAFAAIVWFSALVPDASMRDGLLAPLFLLVIYVFSQTGWVPAKVLSAPWLIVLGESSFGLYLLHIPVYHLFEHLGWSRNASLFPAYLAACIGLSVLSFYSFETPARRFLLKFGRPQRNVRETMEAASDA